MAYGIKPGQGVGLYGCDHKALLNIFILVAGARIELLKGDFASAEVWPVIAFSLLYSIYTKWPSLCMHSIFLIMRFSVSLHLDLTGGSTFTHAVFIEAAGWGHAVSVCLRWLC